MKYFGDSRETGMEIAQNWIGKTGVGMYIVLSVVQMFEKSSLAFSRNVIMTRYNGCVLMMIYGMNKFQRNL